MKKLLTILLTAVIMAVSCDQHEDIWDKLNDHEQIIEQLMKQCSELNSNVKAIQTILNAIENRDYVTEVMKIMEDGVETGYNITFAKSGTITIYHGTNGAEIGVKKASDGAYYWTSNNDWLTDSQGNMIPATITDPDAGYITPQFRIANGIWHVSYDNGNSWREIGGPDNESGNQFFMEVSYDNSYIHLTLWDGEKISIPRNDKWTDGDGGVEYPFSEYGYLGPNGVLTDTYTDNVYYTTEYIDITKASTIYYHGRMGPVSNYYSIAFYDADKKFIQSLSICGTGNIETYYITLTDKYKDAVYVRGSWARGPNLDISATYDFLFIIDGKPAENEAPKKRFAVLGDSIGTHGNEGEYSNVVEMEIGPEDVGVELNAYLTYYDLHDAGDRNKPTGAAKEFVIGGQTYTEADNGKLITFTPTVEDIGKKIGRVYDYNGNSLKTWWLWLAQAYNMEPVPVCWSSSSISSHETTVPRLVNSYAWHDSQIRKCGVRIPGTNNRIAPDYIIIARGTNDWSHSKGTIITDGYFNNPETWVYPTTDAVGTYYGIKEAVSLTVKKMREAYPKAKIFLCTMPFNNRGGDFPGIYGGKSWISFNNAIRECAKFFGCGLIDFAACGLTQESLSIYTSDGTHMNAAGHKLAGEKAIADFASQETTMFW